MDTYKIFLSKPSERSLGFEQTRVFWVFLVEKKSGESLVDWVDYVG